MLDERYPKRVAFRTPRGIAHHGKDFFDVIRALRPPCVHPGLHAAALASLAISESEALQRLGESRAGPLWRPHIPRAGEVDLWDFPSISLECFAERARVAARAAVAA